LAVKDIKVLPAVFPLATGKWVSEGLFAVFESTKGTIRLFDPGSMTEIQR
jgi:hypothetical protein